MHRFTMRSLIASGRSVMTERMQIPARPAQAEAVWEYYHFYFSLHHKAHCSHGSGAPPLVSHLCFFFFFIFELKRVAIALFRTQSRTLQSFEGCRTYSD